MSEPAFAGCKLTCRIVGIIEGEQSTREPTERNDRVVAIEKANQSFSHIKMIADFGKTFCKELEEFFINYHAWTMKRFGCSP